MKQFTILFILSLLTAFSLNATVYTSINDGDWNNSNNWSPSGVPNLSNWPGDEVIITHNITTNQDLTLRHQSTLHIVNGASLISTEKITLSSSHTGFFSLENGGILSCSEFEQKSPSATIIINGTFTCTDELTFSGGATVNISNATLDINDFEIKSNASMNVNNSSVTITGDLKSSGSSQSSFNNTNLSIGNEFEVEGGASSSFMGGVLEVFNKLAIDGAGGIIFDQTDVSIMGDTKLESGANIMVRGDAAVDLGAITIQGGAIIQGQSQGGILVFNSINIQGGGQITCVSGNCNFGAGSTPPSPLNLKTGAQILPIELLFFKATAKNNKVLLSWATTLEQNNDFFEIEKSYDGRHWSILEIIQGAGHSNQRLDYASQDVINTNASSIYYRLKQVDVDGKFSYSAIQIVKNTSKNMKTNIYPNPSNGYFQVQSTLNIERIKIFSAQGLLIETIENDKDGNINVVLPNDIAKGNYIIQLISENGVESHQLVVQ